MEKHAIFLDIDGTITHNGAIHEKTVSEIARCRKDGHLVFVNTGRSYGYIPDCVFNQLELDGFIAGIGSHIIVRGETLRCERVPCDEAVEIARYCFRNNLLAILEGETASLGINTDRVEFKLECAEDIIEKYADFPVTKVYIDKILPADVQSCLADRYQFFQHDTYAEYAMKGSCKSAAMAIVLHELGIPRSRCIAIGDSINDTDMLMYAGISVAMGNADDNIKALCRYVTDTAENGGVGKALEMLIK